MAVSSVTFYRSNVPFCARRNGFKDWPHLVVSPLFRDQIWRNDNVFVRFQILSFYVFFKQKQIFIPMARITCFILGRFPPDIMRCSQLPCGEFVKVCQPIFHVKLEGTLVHGDMTDCDKPFRPLLCTQGVDANLEVNERTLYFVKFQPLFVLANMTAGAVVVRHAVTDVAADLILMDPVVFGIFRFCIIDILMAVQTFWAILHVISIGIVFAVPVHLICLVTLVAFKVLLFVDIRGHPLNFTEVFFPDPASVTCGTDFLHGRPFLEQMPIQQATFHRFRAADVTLPAAAVTRITVRLSGCIHF